VVALVAVVVAIIVALLVVTLRIIVAFLVVTPRKEVVERWIWVVLGWGA
jgi:hypothetical protein